MRKFLNCIHLINHWPEITCLATAQKHYKKRDFRKAKPFPPFHQHVHKPLTDKCSDFQCVRLPYGINKYAHFRADSISRTCTSGQKCPVAASSKVSCMRKTWLTSRRMDQAQCGTFLLRWCSHGAFIWLRAAGTSQLDPWKIPPLHE